MDEKTIIKLLDDIKAGKCIDQRIAAEADAFIRSGRQDILYKHPDAIKIGRIAKFGNPPSCK